jgi:hypothetical protein
LVSSVFECCPACAQATRAADLQCKACGQVLGEIHRCERCRALAPAIERDGALRCAACAAERVPRLGLSIISESDYQRALRKGQLLPWTLFGGAALTGAAGLSVAAGLAAAADGTGGRVLALLLGLGSLACAAALTWIGRTHLERSMRKRRFELEQRVVGLAYQAQGRLAARSVAEALNMPLSAAEAFLTDLTQVGRARLDMSESGAVTYVFPDARPTRGIRVRKDPTGAQGQ